jgi:GTP-binding protein
VGDKIAKQKMSLIFADVPGFGFAFASEDKAKEWHRLMANFVLYRGKSLKRILLLIDARHGFKKADYDFLDSLQQELASNTKKKDGNQRGKRAIQLPPIQIVLTKCDLVTQNDLARRVVQVREQLSDALVREPSALPVMLVCAKAGLGYNNVRGNRARGGILELQRELAALVPLPRDHKQRHS